MGIEGLPLLLLVNPSSGGGRALGLLPAIERELDQRRISFRVERTRDALHATEEARRAAGAGEVPVVVGGDGLVGLVGGELAGSDVPLGIIPGGRGNDLARVLGIPDDPAGAVEVLARGETRRIDVGEANGQRFLGIASCGFDSEANRIANRVRFIRGKLVYVYAALRALVSWRPARFSVRIGDERLRFTGYTLAAANNKAYGGGMYLAPDADLSDGEFDIVLVGKVGKLRFLANLPKVFKGVHVENEEVRIVRAARVEFSASEPFALYADGDHLTDLPASLRVLPGALNVVAPTA
jgi:YegS/Rv2252/BmrU family lipid kinase